MGSTTCFNEARSEDRGIGRVSGGSDGSLFQGFNEARSEGRGIGGPTAGFCEALLPSFNEARSEDRGIGRLSLALARRL